MVAFIDAPGRASGSSRSRRSGRSPRRGTPPPRRGRWTQPGYRPGGNGTTRSVGRSAESMTRTSRSTASTAPGKSGGDSSAKGFYRGVLHGRAPNARLGIARGRTGSPVPDHGP
jgi:hypothetical protein